MLPDSRDRRGKKHELAFVTECRPVVLFLVAILRSDKHLNLSYLHRLMQTACLDLSDTLGLLTRACVSYSQLKRILRGLDCRVFNQINEHFWGSSIANDGQNWYAIDGKELRGSIDGVLGEKRGQNVVSRSQHTGNESLIIDFYNGSKESEKVVVKQYFERAEDLKGKYTLDALHLSSDLLEIIHAKKGIYLVQLKANQKHLLEDCVLIKEHLRASYRCQSTQKAHGRLEVREGFGYDLNSASLESRWRDSHIQTLIVVDRRRVQLKTGKSSEEKSYWVSNMALDERTFEELFTAVREHWRVEVHHHCRDKQMGEDALITRNKNESRFMAICITFVINILDNQNPTNITQLREQYAQHTKNVYELFNRKPFL